MKLLRLALLGACAALTACSNLSGLGGTDKFTCTAPSGIPCRSISAVDHAVRTGQLDAASREAMGQAGGEAGRGAGRDPFGDASGEPSTRPLSQPARPRLVPASGAGNEDVDASLGAIRSEPTVIRIWIAPYEDAEGDLNEASRVYLQIDAGRWLIDHNRARIRREFAPAAARPARVTQGASAPTVAVSRDAPREEK
jgi:conjugal transfer pilus assembly protein TraV